MMNEVSQKMPLLEKISYGAGNMGICLSTTVITTFAMFFYTNVIGINILQVGTILLFGGIVDAISNAFMGVIVDHTKSRWGKCRPYLIFGAIPMAAACFFVFHVPDASASTKYIYALITYIIYTLASAAVLIPQNVLMAAITDDQDDRLATNMFGSLGTNFGQLIPSLMTLGLVAFLGNGSDYKGFNYVILIFGVIGAALTMMAGFNTRERMNMSAIGQQKISAKDTLRSFKNGPWLLVTLITLFIIAQVVVKASTTVYYTTNVLGNPGVSSALLSILSIIGVPITLIIPIIAKKIGKHKLVLMGAAMGIIGNMGLLFTKGSIPGVIACTAFAAAGSAFITGIVFVMCAETVDYGEWKTGIRVQGFLMAFIGFAVKVANSIVQLLISGILNSGGFNGQAKVQTVSAVHAIEFCYVWLPIIFFAAVIILNYFYKLDKIYPQVITDLETRRAAL
ncbi:MFS transporter [Lactococcus piscium]|uniref:MFS transporter n=1 Tax=Pseudolactococcus carnosus TaxID=2749961 RepID=UPI001FBB5BEB|nr:glycoside-pentoside-hexuronide (GPH):cation symporter [Lactococcus carnosus]MCJ1997140.1 MFS transporter [Lactococcus carnosus]